MNLISHRRNTIFELRATDRKYGIEVDIRSKGQDLIIHHDPFVAGESFDEWIDAYQHGTLILNVKEEGLEARLISLMKSKGIEDYFFLDQSFPFLVKWSKAGERRCAVRVSEFESIETVLTLTGRVDWVWVDCFTHFPLTYQDGKRLKSAGFKLCLVSPELQGRNAEIEIQALAALLNERNIEADAVCTKRPDLWEKMIAIK
ncbi:MAG: phosphatidylinositol-specific phospholipase C/glycerophosphodiester phosphodiesterase family protein [Pseudomonadota bacterium]